MSTKPRFLIAGNWKMNKGPNDAKALASELKAAVTKANCDVAVCPPFISLQAVSAVFEGSPIEVGAQNCHFEKSGAFTGEISAAMLSDMGIKYVILGHSERRAMFGETNESVSLRLKGALTAGLKSIVCVGETLEERQSGVTEKLLTEQLDAAFNGIVPGDFDKIVIAYEPVWAIGTGQTATDEQAEAACAFIRKHIAKLFDADTAAAVRVLYGGSMNAGNAAGLLSCPNINGGLIGGASLKAADFAAIVEAAGNAGANS